MLALDCAVSGLGVAVLRGGRVLASHREEGRGQAARLVPALAAALGEARVERRELTTIAVTTGPGSFTGVRVGLATARGLALALGIPAVGVPTTAVLLAEAAHPGRLTVAAIDSGLGDWFCAVAGPDPAPFVATTEALAARLRGQPCLVVGPDAERLAGALDDAIARPAAPDPAILARLALEPAFAGAPARPLYLRGVNVTSPDGARRTVEA